MFYSPGNNAFYDARIHGSAMPGDTIEIDDAVHSALLDGQTSGRLIAAGTDGRPILIDRPLPSDDVLMARLRMRRNAALAASDWTQLADANVTDPDAWRTYRQSLRDLPGTARKSTATGATLAEVSLPDLPGAAA